MRVRVAVALACAIVLGVLVLDMSGRAVRIADTNHIPPTSFVGTLPRGATLCQPADPVASGAGSAQVLVGTFGRPVPALALRFLSRAGTVSAQGQLAAGHAQGEVDIPFVRVRGASPAATVCLHSAGRYPIVLAGYGVAASSGSERIDGRPQPGLVSLTLYRAGRESWWSLLPTLDGRFGLGKATFFGDWSLPLCALLLAGVWVAVIRLLVRQAQ